MRIKYGQNRYFMLKLLKGDGFMNVTLVGTSIENINYCKEHSHKVWEIVIPLKNYGIVEANGEKIEFSEGYVYVIPPNVAHLTYSNSTFSDCYIQINDEILLNKTKITNIFIGKEVKAFAGILQDSYLKRKIGFSKSLDFAASLLIQLIYDNLKEDNDKPLIKDIRNYLIDNMSNSNVNMETLSKKFGYNKDYIRKVFLEATGQTPLEYLKEIRVSRAKDLLIKMQMYSVSEISHLIGFEDPLYFSRCFKKYTGVSPKTYRKSKEMQV